MNLNSYILKINNLKTHFYTEDGVVKAVDGVNIKLKKGEVVGIVGESGCGKSVTALSILKLIPQPPGKIVNGEILFKGENLINFTNKQMQKIRGNKISMVFQEPMTALNPVYTIGNQLIEPLLIHKSISKPQAKELAIEMLKKVKIPSPHQRFKEYPHQLSGGMRQRILIAMALICEPEVLIADEPTTALDVTIQAQILELLIKLKEDYNLSILFITHDLGVIAEIANRVYVMYAGKIVEVANVMEIFSNPLHPYTIGLLNSRPKKELKNKKLETIPGTVPDLTNLPRGCNFSPRCKQRLKICQEIEPNLIEVSKEHYISCHLYNK